MRKFRFIPDNTKIPFMWLWRINFPATVLLSVLSLMLFFTIGPNFGIDFRGGTLIEIKPVAATYHLANIRATVSALNLGDVQVTEVSDVSAEKIGAHQDRAAGRRRGRPAGGRDQGARGLRRYGGVPPDRKRRAERVERTGL